MTESQAWMRVAKRFAAGQTSKYLCHAVAFDGVIPENLKYVMRNRIKEQLGPDIFAYEAVTPETQEARLMALLMLGEMASA